MGSRFKVLGRTQLLIGDHFDDQWATPKVRGILAALLVRPGETVSTDDLTDWVWPPDTEQPSPSTFHTYTKRIRHALGQMADPPTLVPERGAYRIEVERKDVDVYEFLDLFYRATALSEKGDHAAARDALQSAVDLWSDRPLADLDGEGARNWRTAMVEDYWLPAQSDLMRELCALGEFADVLRRLAGLPAALRSNLLVVKRRLEALYGLHRGKDATVHHLEMRRRMLAEGMQEEAEDLRRFFTTLVRRNHAAGSPADDGTSTEPAPPVPHLLPHDITDLVGRDDLLEQLDACTAPSSPVTVCLTGEPGVGKTALAVHWAHRATDRFPGGQFYVNLGGAAGPKVEAAAVVDYFLAELGFPAERIPTAEARASKLRSLLSGRRALVVLDDAASTKHVLPLINCLPCHVLVTSRWQLSRLRLRGSTDLLVPQLRHPDTTQWLANDIGARAMREPGEVTVLAGLCGGNPLALGVVASHIRTRPRISLAEFVVELRDATALLELGADADHPSGILHAAFIASYQSLNPAERRLFALLGIHPGPDISVHVAAALAGTDARSVRRPLDALVDAHLLTQPEVRDRYRFHDLLRRFAAQCATADEYGEVRPAAEQRMLNFYQHAAHNADITVFPSRAVLSLPGPLDGVTPPTFSTDVESISWCIRERANLNSAIAFAGSHGYHKYAIEMPSSTGEIFHHLGYYDDNTAALEIAIKSALASGDEFGLAYSHQNFGFTLLNQRKFEQARSHLTTAKRLYDELGETGGSATATYNLARVQVEQGEYRNGIAGLRTALDAMRDLEAPGAEVKVLHRLAEAHRRAHDLDTAISYAHEGRWLASKLKDETSQGQCLTELARTYYEKGDLPSAQGYAARALTVHIRLNGMGQAGWTSVVLAMIHRDHDEPKAAERHARSAALFCRSGRDPKGQAVANHILGEILLSQARHDEAIEAWSRALTIFEDLGDPQADSIHRQLAELTAVLPLVAPEQTRPLMNDSTNRGLIPRRH